MTAPASRIAEVVAEGRRLEAACRTACDGESAFAIAKAADDLLAFYRRHWPALLDVAEAAAAYQEEMAALGNGADPVLSAALAKLALGPDDEGKEKGNG